MFSMSAFHKQYETDRSPLVVGDRRFEFFVPRTLDPFVDKKDVFSEFPLWSKIWEASIVLANHLATIPPDPDKHLLEIGCGIGLVGVVAAQFGHRITMTEYNQDALNFASANAFANQPPDPNLLEVAPLDWTRPTLEGEFDVILGSEVIYKEEYFEPVLGLFKRYLRPGGEMILAEGVRKTSMAFFQKMSEICDITARKRILRSGGEEKRIVLASMRFK